MSRNISIEEGDYGRKFSPSKLKTNLQSGGSCLWVPKDNTKLVTKRINKAGFYEAKWDEAYGYSKVTVTGIASPDDLKVIEKTVTENGSYSARDDNAAGYNVAKVKVKGGGTYTDEDGKKVTPDPSTSPGSAVVGINPDTGNEEVEKIDDDGNLKTLELASYIQLDTPPTKTVYQDGERIMMSGAVAHGYKKDGTPYKGTLAASELPWHQYGDGESSEYSEDFLPGGIVFEMPQYAEYSGDGSSRDKYTVDPSVLSNAFSYYFTLPVVAGTTHYIYTFDYYDRYNDKSGKLQQEVWCDSDVLLFPFVHVGYNENTYFYIYCFSKNPNAHYYSRRRGIDGLEDCGWDLDGTGSMRSQGRTTRISGATFYYDFGNFGYIPVKAGYPFNVAKNSWNTPPEDLLRDIGTVLFDGGVDSCKQTITLTWPREGDRKHLQTTFDITVTE